MAEAGYAEWLKRGREHQWNGRPVDAMLCFQRACSLDRSAVDPRYLLGEVQWQLGAIPHAVSAWREAARVAPDHLASQLALSEASLAVGDLAAAAAAAAAARSLAPTEPQAIVLDAVARFAQQGDLRALDPLAEVVEPDPSRLVSPVTGGTLARALSLHASSGSKTPVALYGALLRHLDRIALALLVPLARASFDRDSTGSLRAARDPIVAAALDRPVAPGEVDVLREIAHVLARAGERDAALRLAAKYGQATIAFTEPFAPSRWPLRTAGAALRCVALLPVGEAEAHAAVDRVLDVAGRVRDAHWLLLSRHAVSQALPSNVVVRLLAGSPDAAIASAVAAEDPDVLFDFAGAGSASGTFLAHRPAWHAIGVDTGAGVYPPPLVDEVIGDDVQALAERLAAIHVEIARRPTGSMSARELNDRFATAVEAHRSEAFDAAAEAYEAIVAEQPAHAPTLHLLASIRTREERFDEAKALLERALDAAPDYVEARVACARLARSEGDPERGLALIDAGLGQWPRVEAFWRVRGELELARDDGVAAAAAFTNALALKPTDAEAHYNLGVALQKQGRHNEAARAYQRALAFDPDFADAHFNLAVLFQETGHTAASVSAYRAVLERDRGRVAAYRNLGEVLFSAGRVDEWIENFRRFESQCPDALPLAVQALEVCQYAADNAGLERYLEGLRGEKFRATDAIELADSLEQLLYLLLFFDVEAQVIHRFAQTYASTAAKVYGAPLPRRESRRPGRLRIGYLSADLRNHVMGKMMWHAIEHHDRDRFSLHFYSLSAQRDAWTERFERVADRFAVVAGLSERAAADRIAEDDLDLLVDLSGHTKGAKPGILARKPARVQITHVASAGSVGLDTVDFKLTDAFADVPENQETMVETLLPMQGCVYPYRHIEPAAGHPFHRATLRIPQDAVVIGAFVTPMKLSRRCLVLWRDVLARIPRARLAFSPTHPALRPVFVRLCQAAGIAADRLLFLPQGRDDAENQARYGVVDFVLDPMPFGGVNGVLEPLDAGVPVVTLVGKRHGERSAYSILANLGVTQTVAHGGREYVDIAVRLANDATFTRSVREAIRAGLAGSALVDMRTHTLNLEAAYMEALRRNAPEALAASGHG